MRLCHRLGLFGLLSLSATVFVSGQGRGAAPVPPPGNPSRPALADRIAHSDPARYRTSPSVHGGAGALAFGPLFAPTRSTPTCSSCIAA